MAFFGMNYKEGDPEEANGVAHNKSRDEQTRRAKATREQPTTTTTEQRNPRGTNHDNRPTNRQRQNNSGMEKETRTGQTFKTTKPPDGWKGET